MNAPFAKMAILHSVSTFTALMTKKADHNVKQHERLTFFHWEKHVFKKSTQVKVETVVKMMMMTTMFWLKP